jgi:hypothetical protein
VQNTEHPISGASQWLPRIHIHLDAQTCTRAGSSDSATPHPRVEDEVAAELTHVGASTAGAVADFVGP